jgi:hypothetical protein
LERTVREGLLEVTSGGRPNQQVGVNHAKQEEHKKREQ